MSVHASICLVALESLRASAFDAVHRLAGEREPQLGRLRDRLLVDLTASHPVYLANATSDELARELARLCEIGAEVVATFRQRRFDEHTSDVIRSFEDALSIAQRVLRVGEGSWPSSGVHRAVPRVADPIRRDVG